MILTCTLSKPVLKSWREKLSWPNYRPGLLSSRGKRQPLLMLEVVVLVAVVSIVVAAAVLLLALLMLLQVLEVPLPEPPPLQAPHRQLGPRLPRRASRLRPYPYKTTHGASSSQRRKRARAIRLTKTYGQCRHWRRCCLVSMREGLPHPRHRPRPRPRHRPVVVPQQHRCTAYERCRVFQRRTRRQAIRKACHASLILILRNRSATPPPPPPPPLLPPRST